LKVVVGVLEVQVGGGNSGLTDGVLITSAIFRVDITWFVFKGIILATSKLDRMFCSINAPIKALKNPARKSSFATWV
jgi:hypothetical protein